MYRLYCCESILVAQDGHTKDEKFVMHVSVMPLLYQQMCKICKLNQSIGIGTYFNNIFLYGHVLILKNADNNMLEDAPTNKIKP